jgi:pimeloyl-ACP methyl ester carboxylesterase
MWNTSLWDYKKGGFRQLINTISDKSVLLPHALANFREVDQLPRKFKQMQVQEVSANPNLILELWSSRLNMPSEKEYRLGCKKAFREKQLIDSLAETYPIDTKLAKSKVVLGRYSDDERTFCYALEVVIAPRTDLDRSHAGQIEIIDSVNNNASSDGDGSYFSGGSYRWEGRKCDYYTRLYASTIRNILSECGFVTSGNFSKRRKPCVMFINLRCRCIEWLPSSAEDIYQLLSQLGTQKINLVGHDVGVLTAYSYAASHPNNVSKLVILDVPPLPLPGFETCCWWFSFHQTPDIPEMLTAGKEREYLSWFYKFAYNPEAITQADIDRYVASYSAPGGMRAGFEYYRAFPITLEQNKDHANVKLPMPVLALGGEYSFGPAALTSMKALATDVRGGVVPLSGHWIAEERPDFLIKELAKFFSE